MSHFFFQVFERFTPVLLFVWVIRCQSVINQLVPIRGKRKPPIAFFERGWTQKETRVPLGKLVFLASLVAIIRITTEVMATA